MRLGRIEVSGGFLLLAAALNYMDRQGVVLPALAACLLHELGHYAAVRLLGGRVRRVRVTVAGAEMHLAESLSYGGELLSALAGPGVNLLLAAVCCRWEGGVLFAGLNLALGLFNLLPVTGMDGGRILNCALALLAPPQRWESFCLLLDTTARGLLLALGALLVGWGGNFTLLLVALWLNLSGARVRETGAAILGIHPAFGRSARMRRKRGGFSPAAPKPQ